MRYSVGSLPPPIDRIQLPLVKVITVKGPGFRYDLDVRRVWRCPTCGKDRKVPGDVSTVRCGCHADAPWMVLVAEAAMQPKDVAEIIARFDSPRQPREPEPELPPRTPSVKSPPTPPSQPETDALPSVEAEFTEEVVNEVVNQNEPQSAEPPIDAPVNDDDDADSTFGAGLLG